MMNLKSYARLLPTALLFFLLAYPASGQSAEGLEGVRQELLKEMEELREGQKRIERELDELNELIRGKRPRPFQPVTLSYADDPFKGNKNARVVLLDFSDYQ